MASQMAAHGLTRLQTSSLRNSNGRAEQTVSAQLVLLGLLLQHAMMCCKAARWESCCAAEPQHDMLVEVCLDMLLDEMIVSSSQHS
jgi:hypothetical protein